MEGGIARFLEHASGHGSKDSEGVFTIARGKAIAKLAAFQFHNPRTWILKIVQAAVASGSSGLQIKQGSKSTRFQFSPALAFCPEELEALLTGQPGSFSRHTQNLAVGLRAVGFAGNRPFTFATSVGRRCEVFSWNKGDLKRRTIELDSEAPPFIEIEVLFKAGARGRVVGNLVRSAGQATAEYLEVQNKAGVCPIPLLFDGRRLDCLTIPKDNQRSVPLALGYAPQADEGEIPTLGVPQALDPVTRPRGWDDRLLDHQYFCFRGEPGQRDTKAIGRLWLHLPSKQAKYPNFVGSLCLWVRDGVVARESEIPIKRGAVSLDIYVPADGLETDLSGLAVKRDERAMKRERAALETILPLLGQVETELAEQPVRSGKKERLAAGVTLLSGALTPVTAGKSLLVGSLLAALAVRGPSAEAEQRKRCRAQTRAFARVLKNYLGDSK